MPIDDSGWYNPGGYPNTPFRDIIVWPPGWRPPTSTENVTLGGAVTVSSGGLLIAGTTTSAGERWQAASGLPKSRRVGWIPGSAAGSYSAGSVVPIARVPRFSVGHRVYRGGTALGFFAAKTSYPAIALRSVERSRASNSASIKLESAHSFIVGQTIEVSGIGGSGYNGTFKITGITLNNIFYLNPGPNESVTADLSGCVSVGRSVMAFRLPQFSALRPWVRTTGPQAINANNSFAGFDQLAWSRLGISLRLVTCLVKPFDRDPLHGFIVSQIYNVWAPIAAEETPDFCIDVDLPDYQTMRIVWFSGIPQSAYPSLYNSPPYSGATLSGRRYSHTDRIFSYSGIVTAIGIKEDAGIIRAIASLGTPAPTGVGGGNAIRASLFPTMTCSTPGPVDSFLTGTVHSCTGQWYLRKADATTVAVGISVSLSYYNVFDGFNYNFYTFNSVSGPADPARVDTPGSYFFKVVWDYTNSSGGRSFFVYDSNPYGFSSANDYWLRASGEWNPLHPWPWDVPFMSFAANESAVRYVSNTGWLMGTPVTGTITITPPTLSRAGTTITAAIGTAVAADVAENVVSPLRGVVLRALAPSVPVGGENGSNGSSASINLTVAGFAALPVQAQATELWSVKSTAQGSFCTLRDLYPGSSVASL